MHKGKEFIQKVSNQVLLFDGGMGTELYNRGVFINQSFEELNLKNPSLVKAVHSEYRKAGADVLETNTFGANRFKLGKFQLADQVYEINLQASKLACEVAGEDLFVAGSVGPLGVQIEPLGPISNDEARDFFKEQIRGLVDGGADLLIFETFIYPNELEQAVRAAREICDLPIIAQMTIDEDASSLTGTSPAIMVDELNKIGADIIGVNCTVGPQVMLNWLEQVRKHTNLPISIMPNAGKPRNIDGRNIYLSTPEYFGEYAKHFIKSGANIIGGCCGTGPEHIQKMRASINAQSPHFSTKKYEIKNISVKEQIPIIPIAKKSRLAKRLSDGHFVKIVELLAPKGVSAENEIQKARELYYGGIDAINIPDGPRASSRMSSLALATMIQNQVGIEVVLHFVCRDLNVIAIQSNLLGAYSLGIKNVLAITGDPPKIGNYPDATGVFDVDSIGLINIINRLNNGLDISGAPIGNPTGFHIGCGANPGALNLDQELKRIDWKIEAGAEFIMTQPVFDLHIFENFFKRIEHYKIPIIAGIWPLTSLRNAEFMNNEVPGCNVPNEILEQFRKVETSKDKSRILGIEIANKTLSSLMGAIQGVQISVPFGNIQSAFNVLDGIH
ncbi:MAG TPA: bifunctional homocysteine S-methyltransferase/methylenetetrahydrofolate reductase [Bacteroidetes bacterium]|nr:bifunctional homocysteine S-methyltransferase/methylenetetrahydrofolate reductase [Bacteroidota bacterium]